MKHYDILLRLSGSRDNEVRRFGLSAAEVVLLNQIHGGEAVSELTERPELEKAFTAADHRTARARMVTAYGQKPETRNLISQTFGNVGSLPEAVTMEDLAPVGGEDFDEEKDDLEPAETEPVAKEPEIRPETADPEDAKEAIKASIRELGGDVPRGNASVETLRGKLQELQRAQLGLDEAEDASNDVMA